jgi:predicted nucleic acid-binding protein
MSELCIDASVVVKLVFPGEPHRATARRLVSDCVANSVTLIAPHFFESEVDTAIIRRILSGELTVEEGHRAFALLDRVSVQLTSDPLVRRRARAIAERFGQPAVYDSTYAALAEIRNCEFWTADKDFYDAVRATLPFVRYLPDYP